MEFAPRVIVIGLGYVGLPLAVALAKRFETVGFDIDEGRIAELRAGRDRTGEVDPPELRASRLKLHRRSSDANIGLKVTRAK